MPLGMLDFICNKIRMIVRNSSYPTIKGYTGPRKNQYFDVLGRQFNKAQPSMLNSGYSNSWSCMSTFVPQEQIEDKGIFLHENDWVQMWKKYLSICSYLSSLCICLFLFCLRHPHASGMIKIGRTKMQRENKNQYLSCERVFEARAR